MGAMPWRELADLPLAAALRAHRGGLGPRGAIVTSAQLAGDGGAARRDPGHRRGRL